MIGTVDALVDAHLGDPVWYRAEGSSRYVKVPGFFLNEAKGGYDPELDDITRREQLKISQQHVPEVRRGDRIKRSMESPVTYQPENANPEEDGRYWIFNIQRVTDDF